MNVPWISVLQVCSDSLSSIYSQSNVTLCKVKYRLIYNVFFLFRWVIFNDQKVCASEKPPKDLGYLYFYRRVTE